MTDGPNAITRLVDKILERTGLTRELAMQTPIPVLLALSLMIDEVDDARKRMLKTQPPPKGSDP
jgi:hypothetical protein